MSVVAVAPGAPADHHAGTLSVATAMARRYALGMVRIPATLAPTLLMPLFFVIAFGGSFSGLTELPGFPTDNILNWMAPFAALQGCAFAGFGAAFYVARDLETGFHDRLLVAPTPNGAIMLGPVLYAMGRAVLPLAIVLPAALVGGARLEGGLAGLAVLVVAALGVAVLSCLWGLGVVYRLKTQSAGALVQIVITVSMFLSIGQVPLGMMEGWLHAVARVNPVTPILELGRQGFLGPVTAADTLPGLAAIAVMGIGLTVFARRGFATLVP